MQQGGGDLLIIIIIIITIIIIIIIIIITSKYLNRRPLQYKSSVINGVLSSLPDYSFWIV